MTAEQALERLLVGTGVGYVFTARDLVTMDIRTSEFVAVSGRETPTVTSPKYTTPLRDVPQTIALIPRATIEQQGATTLSETLRNVPGITLQAGEAGGASNTAGDMFNMRGFNASNSLFVDGVRDDGLVSRDVFNIEQVEVFMGPTGSDVGRGTAAGYVNMSTKVPHLGSSSAATFAYGNGDRGRRHGRPQLRELRQARTAGGASRHFVVNALWQDGGVPGRDEVDQQSRAVAPSLAFGLGTPTRLTASVADPSSGQPAGLRHSRRRVAGRAADADDGSDTGARRPGQLLRQPLVSITTTPNRTPIRLRLEHDVNRRFTLRNQTRYNHANRDAIISTIQNPAAYNPATNQVAIVRQGNIRENTIASNQTSMIGRFSTGRTSSLLEFRSRVHTRIAVRADGHRNGHARAGRRLSSQHQ